MLVQREIDWRDAKRLTRLLKAAKLKLASACLEDIDWRASRGLDRNLVTSLAGGDWLRHGHNVLITGATGVGKTWLACALAQQAARSGFTVLYVRAPRLLEELRVAHGDGSFGRRLAQLARIDLLAIDDFAIAPVTARAQRSAGVARRPGRHARHVDHEPAAGNLVARVAERSNAGRRYP
jgi:DNA replication protein DnaC